MRKFIITAAALVALAVPFTAVAGNGPNNKVTGSIEFNNPGYGPATFTFSGQDVVGGPDKGTATYTDGMGTWSGNATAVTVSATTAIMTVQITSSTHPDVAPQLATFTFYDTGEAGTSDEISDYFTTVDGGPHYVATAGNIQVHFAS